MVYETPMKYLSGNLVRIVQFKIHSCFRTEVHPRNPHTLTPKLALVDILWVPVQEYERGKQEEGFLGKDTIWKCLRKVSFAREEEINW